MTRGQSRLAVFALAAVPASAIAYDIWRTPIQVWDAIEEMLDPHRPEGAAAVPECTGVQKPWTR